MYLLLLQLMRYCQYLLLLNRFSYIVLLLLPGVCGSSLFAQTPPVSQDGNSFISRTLFLPRISLNAGKENWDVCSADFNLDGFRDLAVVSKNDNTIRVLYNNGAASFEDAIILETVTQPRAVCTLDANGDGHQDLAVVSLFGELAVLINDGTGDFRPGFSMETDMAGMDIVSADVNGDRNEDLALALVNGNVVWVMAGNGAGGFSALDPVETGNKPRVIRLYDFNADAYPDLVVGCDDGQIHLMLNNGAGGFGEAQNIRASADSWGMAIGDMDGDGQADIITSSYTDAEVCVFLNKGAGKFGLPQRLIAGEHNFGVEVADFDKDGDLDIVSCSTNDKQIYFFANTGKGEFETARMFLSGYWNSALVAHDFDADGDPDVVTVSINDSRVNIHRNIVSEREFPKGVSIIRGVLYNHNSQMPSAMTPITVCNSAGDVVTTTLSNDKGEYAVGVSGEDVYTMLAKSGTLPVYCAAIRVSGEKEIVHDLSVADPAIATLHGQVTSARDGRGIARALVRLFNRQGVVVGQAQTTQSGLFRVTAKIGEEVKIVVSHRWFQSYEGEIVVEKRPDGTLSLNIVLQDKRDLAAIEGTILDSLSGMPLSGATVVVTDPDAHPIAQIRTELDGHFSHHLPEGRYQVQMQANGYYFSLDTLEIMPTDLGKIIPMKRRLLPLENGSTIVLEGIFFQPGDARIDALSMGAMQRIFHVLDDNPDLIVEISGHTDSDGADNVNLRLSQARAQAVVSYLTQTGISPQRLIAKGYGETKPVAPNDTLEHKYRNRRIELTVIGSLQVVGDRE